VSFAFFRNDFPVLIAFNTNQQLKKFAICDKEKINRKI
jgi:hypothetical protein